MPPLPATPQVLKFRVLGDCNNVNIDNVFHAAYSGDPPTDADCIALAELMHHNFVSNFLGEISIGYTLRETVCQDLTSSSASSGAFAETDSGGDGAAAAAPQSICAVVSWKITRRYRGGKPRTYLGPLRSIRFPVANRLDDTWCSNLRVSATAFRTAVSSMSSGTTNLTGLGCVSYYSNRALRSAGLFEPFTGEDVDDRPGSQRRRLGKLSTTRD